MWSHGDKVGAKGWVPQFPKQTNWEPLMVVEQEGNGFR